MTWHDLAWLGMTLHGLAWLFMTFHDFPWLFMTFHDFSDFSWLFMTFHEKSLLFMTFHDLAWLSMTWHDLAWPWCPDLPDLTKWVIIWSMWQMSLLCMWPQCVRIYSPRNGRHRHEFEWFHIKCSRKNYAIKQETSLLDGEAIYTPRAHTPQIQPWPSP